jgi:hypothetical protein
MPLFHNRGEISGGAYTTTSGNGGTIAYSPLDHFGVAASFIDSRDDRGGNPTYERIRDVAAVYYSADNVSGERFRFEAVAGFGDGVNNTYAFDGFFSLRESPWIPVEAAYNRYFLQVTLGQSDPAHDGSADDLSSFEGGIALRISMLKYSKFISDGVAQAPPSLGVFEPITVIRYGLKNVKAELEFGASLPFGEQSDWKCVYLGLGIHVVLGRIGI